ncbi:hypothetical protein C5B42_04890 [Candidatus Cerribacteria bacterium 'Amazon FNV 2010 28 9']|uniref:SHS2 domain-containing protein n=1 Tax=Candidatus Cerribacteria bacterium 'Amazon FNV 2010 28 9' TaxID=2081795 RepID=A0A317JP29_9BACT|nr:MAG: hypothetical protein C5B42_04890 [Candidatus Cerribacteria bacterium 'Amazon FNV 2010 28 9']
MNAVGFDLGSSSLKIMEASKEGDKYRALQALEFANPFGVMIPPDAAQLEQLAGMLKQVLHEHKLPLGSIRTALPESLISTKIISTPTLTDAELASAIDWLAEQHIAIPLEELKIEYEVLYRPDKSKSNDQNMRVMLIGVPKRVVTSYLKVFELMEVEPVVMETQVLAALRPVINDQLPTTLLVHMGASSTELVIVHEREIVFVYSFASGGRLLTRSIERGLNLDTQQAEEYKKSYGVDPQFLEGKLVRILDPVMRLFVNEMQKALQYFTGQFGTLRVKRIVFSGGGANLQGIIPFFASQFDQEVVVANPFDRFVSDVKTPIPTDRAPSFDVSCGLVLRDI